MVLALVTGATSGIGEQFAEQLAARGDDLIVVARRRGVLEQLATRLNAAHGIKVEVIAADLSESAQLRTVEERLAHGDVKLLVNNAGFALGAPFTASDTDEETRMIAVNIVAVQRLTHAVLPSMMRDQAGGIINVSSVAGFAPAWPNSGYPATKAWVTNFSECLAHETRRHGITVQALCPGFTRTAFFANNSSLRERIPRGFELDAATVVRESLRDLERRRLVSVPTLRYKAIGVLLRHIPHWFLRRFSLRTTPHSGH